MKGFIPREGGIVALWSCGTAIGLVFLVRADAILSCALYLAGSILFLGSVDGVKELVRLRILRQKPNPKFLIAPLLGALAWGIAAYGRSLILLGLVIALLAFSSFSAMERREREWQTRVAFTAAVVLMALLGLFVSGYGLGAPEVAILFMVPFAFFSAQELLVQHIAETLRASKMASVLAAPREVERRGNTALLAFLGLYAVASAATLPFTSTPLFPVVLELILVSFPLIWLSSRRRVSFKRLGIESAVLDALVTVTIVWFSLSPR